MLAAFLSGAFMTSLAIIGVIFFRSWRDSGDRFFGYFGLGFAMLALERIPLVLWNRMKEPGSLVYLIRLAAFLLIIAAILEKNRKANAPDNVTHLSDFR